MGLDMYLTGEHRFLNDGCDPRQVASERRQLGYWRKHPNLHGFIVREFADGVDDCQELHLTSKHIRTILRAIEQDQLPSTTGFFFGHSDGREKPHDRMVFTTALRWLETTDEVARRRVFYQASW